MLRTFLTYFSSKLLPSKEKKGFSSMSSREKKRIIEKAARLSAQDQEKLLKEYERRFGHKQFFSR